MTSKKNIRVAIQGIVGSFHERTALAWFKEPIQTVDCLSFPSLFQSLENDQADAAVTAIENSIAGSILPNYTLLQQHHFKIIDELYLPIHLHLMALPGSQKEDIKVIESHPMAIRQCADFLQGMQGLNEVRESDDTALSAKRIKELGLKETAAIANEWAAERFGLEILERRIETHKKNFTRFLVLAGKDLMVEVSPNKTSISFEVSNEVGSLADSLMIFKIHRINLSKIQSIPILGKPQQYAMHIDVEWTQRRNYDQAMLQLLKEVKNLNVLGEYQKGKIAF
jgi:prephenate dehydratase